VTWQFAYLDSNSNARKQKARILYLVEGCISRFTLVVGPVIDECADFRSALRTPVLRKEDKYL
jgi:hypothetical protein